MHFVRSFDNLNGIFEIVLLAAATGLLQSVIVSTASSDTTDITLVHIFSPSHPFPVN